jgi:hypothetical protein
MIYDFRLSHSGTLHLQKQKKKPP